MSAAAARSTRLAHPIVSLEDLNERIGFSSLAPNEPAGRKDKLTVAEMNRYDMAADIDERVAALLRAAAA